MRVHPYEDPEEDFNLLLGEAFPIEALPPGAENVAWPIITRALLEHHCDHGPLQKCRLGPGDGGLGGGVQPLERAIQGSLHRITLI